MRRKRPYQGIGNVPLRKWLYAMYLVVMARRGVSSLQLSKEVGVTQKMAWFMLGRLREAGGSDSGLLARIVEVDETCIGGKEQNKHAGKKLKAGRGPGDIHVNGQKSVWTVLKSESRGKSQQEVKARFRK